MLRDVLKQYDTQRHLLVMPELFDFAFQPSRGKTLRLHPVATGSPAAAAGDIAQGRSVASGSGSGSRWRVRPAGVSEEPTIISSEPTITSGTRHARGQCHRGQTSPRRVLYRAGTT